MKQNAIRMVKAAVKKKIGQRQAIFILILGGRVP